MLDPRFVREHPAVVEQAISNRGASAPLKELLDTDDGRRRLLREVEELKARRNQLTQQVAEAKRHKADAAAFIEGSRALGERISELEGRLRTLEEALAEIALKLPNVPHPSVPVGHSAEENVEIRRWGEPRIFPFTPRPHWEVGDVLGILDFERAAKIAKARFAVLWGPGARLSRALSQLMLDLHTRERGYREVWVPHLVNRETMVGTAQLPKFEEQLFKTQDADEGRQLYLIPTAEVPLTALHTGETLPADTLPRKYTAFTPCYRREAGTYGQDTKGMIRQHQFDKVELVKLTTPASSYDELERMVEDAEAVLQRLELPYRVVLLCTGDMGFASAKTYDLEVWLPGQDRYREISSCSNCEAFQARRAEVRYRPAGGGKAEYLHTLNGSGLAVGRTLIAVLENYQEADGTVVVPEALRPYLDGQARLSPAP
ncbi:MAG TPA: serine--tRNA ligase [Methylomirabilota bacterium]|jgi:seryl-tRNA synthetase|nr:serine--tRNA ligase [Methylomirabilota bacterium]